MSFYSSFAIDGSPVSGKVATDFTDFTDYTDSAEFRKTLHSDGLILSWYTYNMRDTRTELDSDQNVKRTDVKTGQSRIREAIVI